jgi:prepilin-type N-terminal cleavage/methylation domain-containing protein/uncharacterized delta-60 repeat protein
MHKHFGEHRNGFTIVELLVVIVVIGILAAITVISYFGINQRAVAATLQSDLKNAATKLEVNKVSSDDESYPPDQSEFNDAIGFAFSTGNTATYNYYAASSSYCLEAENTNGTSYYITSSDQRPTEGDCPLLIAASFAKALSNTTSGHDYGRSTYVKSDGSYAVAGQLSTTNGNVLLAQYAANGELSSSSSWGGASTENVTSVIGTSDSGLMVIGSTSSYGAGNGDIFLAKYGSDNSLSWVKTWGSTLGTENPLGATPTYDGGFVVAGYGYEYTHGSADGFIVKFDSSGSEVWSRYLGGTGLDNLYGVTELNDNSLVTVGITQNYGAGSSDVMIAKYTSDGTLSWTKTWGYGGTDSAYAINKTTDGGFVVAGKESSAGYAFISKYDSAGTTAWTKTWGGSTIYNQAGAVIQTSDGGYALAGQTRSFGAGYEDIFLVRYSSDGTFAWDRVFGTTDWEYTQSITEGLDDGLLLTGYSNHYDSGNNDLVLVKYSSGGDMNGCSSECVDPSATMGSPSTQAQTVPAGSYIFSDAITTAQSNSYSLSPVTPTLRETVIVNPT